MSVSDLGVIYSAVLSTATAIFGGRRWWRGRKLSVSFSYGWSDSRGEPATLTIRVHNNSPLRTIHLLQVGWRSPDGTGDWWDAPGASVVVEAGGSYSHDLKVGTPPITLMANVILGDRSIQQGHEFHVPYSGVSISGDEMQLRSDS